MYCGCCGSEIPNRADYCPACGAEVAQVLPKPARNHKRQKTGKIIRGCLILAFAAILLITGFALYSGYAKALSIDQIQMTSNNLQNGAIVASDSKWLYYNHNGLSKMRIKDGSKQATLSSDIQAQNLFCLGEKLYYYNFPGYFLWNGDSGKDLGFSVFTENCIQSDGKKFFVTGFSNYEDNGVYSTKVTDTKKGTKLSDIAPSKILLQGEYLFVLSEYTTINEMPNDNYGTWRMDKNGKHPIKILDFCPRYLVFSGDQVFYANKEKIVCSMNLDGTGKREFDGIYANYGLNVSEEYIFSIDSSTQRIHRMNKDGSSRIVLNNNRSDKISIIGDWIYYQNQDSEYVIYKMSFDGQYNQPIY